MAEKLEIIFSGRYDGDWHLGDFESDSDRIIVARAARLNSLELNDIAWGGRCSKELRERVNETIKRYQDIKANLDKKEEEKIAQRGKNKEEKDRQNMLKMMRMERQDALSRLIETRKFP